MNLDEHVIPTTVTDIVNVPPFRRNPVRGTGTAFSSTGNVGVWATCKLHLSGSASSDSNAVFVVDTIILRALDNVIATGALLPNARAYANLVAVRAVPIIAPALYTAERYPPPATIAEFALPIGFRIVTQGTDPLLDLGALLTVDGGDVEVFQGEWPLSGLMEINFASANAATAANNSALSVTVSGLMYGLGGT